MNNSASALRVLDPKLTLTGASGDALENLLVDDLPNGALCWVISESSLWYLAKYSLEAVGADVIATSRGSSVKGRWKRATGGALGFEPAYSEIFLGGGVSVPNGANWQGLPTGEVSYTVMESQNINDENDVFAIPADQPAGVFLVRAHASFEGEETEENDRINVGLALSRNNELIGGAAAGQAQGRQEVQVVYPGSSQTPIFEVSAERTLTLDPEDTVRGILQVVNVVGNAEGIVLLNYTVSILRLNAT